MITQSAHIVFIVYNTPCLYDTFYEVEMAIYFILASVCSGYTSVWLLYTEIYFHFGFGIHTPVQGECPGYQAPVYITMYVAYRCIFKH